MPFVHYDKTFYQRESYEPLSVGCLLFPDEYRSIITVICEVHHVVALSHAER